jgi:hypothetical protein
MRRSFAISKPVLAAEGVMDQREEVERAVHLSACKIEWLPYRMV